VSNHRLEQSKCAVPDWPGNQEGFAAISVSMPKVPKILIRVLALLLLAMPMRAANAQEQEVDDQLMASRRLFKNIGPGLRALRRGADGKYYLLASPNVGLAVFDAQGKQLTVIGAPPAEPATNKAGGSAIAFGEDCAVDASGNIYIVDRGFNLINEFAPDGKLLRSIPVNAPTSVAALVDGQVAVTSLRGSKLVSVYDSSGKLIREFGDQEELATRPELNRYLSRGRLSSDSHGHIYYGYSYLPEPRVRQYDLSGIAGMDFEFTGLGAWSEGRAMRKEIERLDSRVDPPSLLPVLTAFGVDPNSGDVWMCMHNTLLHFDKDGVRQSEYQIYTPNGARLEATVLLVEEDRLLIGADPLGVYEFHRPDKKQ
jgi:hypothetical protein